MSIILKLGGPALNGEVTVFRVGWRKLQSVRINLRDRTFFQIGRNSGYEKLGLKVSNFEFTYQGFQLAIAVFKGCRWVKTVGRGPSVAGGCPLVMIGWEFKSA